MTIRARRSSACPVRVVSLAAAVIGLSLLLTPRGVWAQGPPEHPSVTVHGQVYTPRSILARNMGSNEDQTTAFTPHKVIGNIYYVGVRTLSAFLIVTPQGNILMNSTYERNVPVIQKSIADLGFKFADTKILVGSHAHTDHMEGDAVVKQLTGAQVVAMAEDVDALKAMTPGGKAHPIDRVIHDGDTVTLGATTLVAHLTPGHTRGCTTWTLKANDSGKSYDVAIIGSAGTNPGFKLVNNPDIPHQADEYEQAFKVLHALHVDVPLGSHPSMYNLDKKYPLIGKGPNPFIDPAGYKLEVDIAEAMFRAVLAEQKKAAGL